MKPAPFDYHVPCELEEALALMEQYGNDAKVLAGGQSLVPAMNFRLARPSVLVDLNNLSQLSYIVRTETDGLRVGAMTRQRSVERSHLVKECSPLTFHTMPYIAHVQIRNRGTFGGSIAHADPAAELPAVAVTLNAKLKLERKGGSRWVNAEDFYIALFTTELMPQEIITEVELPPLLRRTGWSVHEVSRRQGDYAIAGAVATVTLNDKGACEQARLIYFSVGDGPIIAHHAARLLSGQIPTAEAIEEAAYAAAQQDIDPITDIHASAEYRRHLVKVLTQKVLADAISKAQD